MATVAYERLGSSGTGAGSSPESVPRIVDTLVAGRWIKKWTPRATRPHINKFACPKHTWPTGTYSVPLWITQFATYEYRHTTQVKEGVHLDVMYSALC